MGCSWWRRENEDKKSHRTVVGREEVGFVPLSGTHSCSNYPTIVVTVFVLCPSNPLSSKKSTVLCWGLSFQYIYFGERHSNHIGS